MGRAQSLAGAETGTGRAWTEMTMEEEVGERTRDETKTSWKGDAAEWSACELTCRSRHCVELETKQLIVAVKLGAYQACPVGEDPQR